MSATWPPMRPEDQATLALAVVLTALTVCLVVGAIWVGP